MTALLDLRQERILLAIIREYISTAEPVGSSALAQKYNFECSPATIRAEMARLEELGYLYHPHTSAGRVPCDRAYRYYVDRLLRSQLAPPPEAPTIVREVQETQRELDALIEHTSRLLAQITHYTSIVLGPRLGRSFFKYLQLVAVGPHAILMVMMTHTGGVVHRVIEVSFPVVFEDLTRVTNLLNHRLAGMPVDAINMAFLQHLPEAVDREILERVGEATRDLARESQERVFYEGAANLLDQPEFRDVQKARSLLEILEEEKLVAEIMHKSLHLEGVRVVIGAENHFTEMRDCTMVTASYQVEGVRLGTIGVLGPTRLPYDRVISIVQCVADTFGKRLSQSGL